jgi:hypothetical protein
VRARVERPLLRLCLLAPADSISEPGGAPRPRACLDEIGGDQAADARHGQRAVDGVRQAVECLPSFIVK